MKMKRFILLALLCCLYSSLIYGQPTFNKAHGLYKSSFLLKMTSSDPEAEIRYTTDCSEPTAQSTLYTSAMFIKTTTIFRAAEFKNGERASAISTVSYIFPNAVLNQSNTPDGYPSTWGNYTTMSGTAIADYEMDPEMTGDRTLSSKIVNGFYTLPVLSLVTDKGNLFNKTKDENTGGIYIYTGTSDNNGRGWERPVSVELMGGEQAHDLSVTCSLKLHGGMGRVPEKNPKHSFRLTFKSDYGPGKLKYPVFGDSCVDHFNSLIVRTFYNFSWTHSDASQRTMAQYERDMWARRMQMRMGYCSSDGIYVHVFLNGMYWGLYNLAERIDDYYCKQHGGGKKGEYDVVKREDYLEAAEGTLDKWKEMIALTEKASDNNYYEMLLGKRAVSENSQPEVFLNVDNFIDYMLINQYAGNADWDQHNWIAFFNREDSTQGFNFICWDSENTFQTASKNVLGTNNKDCPTYILNNLMKNRTFQHRFWDRAYKHLSDGGALSTESAIEVWDSLYNQISGAVYDEAARWGDYRRDVHPYSSKGELYTVDDFYLPERTRLLTNYFPVRTNNFKGQLQSKGWYPKVEAPSVLINGQADAGQDTLTWDDELTLSGATYIAYTLDESDPVSWVTTASGTVMGNLYSKENILSSLNGKTGWFTLRMIAKGSGGWSATVDRRFYLDDGTGIMATHAGESEQLIGIYNLMGQKVEQPTHGIYIEKGRKVLRK